MLSISSLFRVNIFIRIKTIIQQLQVYISIKEIFCFKNAISFTGSIFTVKQEKYTSTLQRGGNMEFNTYVQITEQKSEN